LQRANREGKEVRARSQIEGTADWIIKVSKNNGKNETKRNIFHDFIREK
jgi:hypothetical protein